MKRQTEENLKKELKSLISSKNTDYQAFLEKTLQILEFDKENLRFSIDSNTITHLGSESIKDHTTAVLELVKNSYDADAKKVIVELEFANNQSYIRIADNGIGMSEEEIIKNWLRIGYSEKKQKKKTKLKRRKTGEKGIGRLSADRLGSEIKLLSKTKNTSTVGLTINWDDFKSKGKDLMLIPFKRIKNEEIKLPNSKQGTEIIIESFRNEWTSKDVERLYEELSLLTSPFKIVKNFSISLKSNLNPSLNGIIKHKEHLKPEVEISVFYDGESDSIQYTLKDKYKFSKGKEESILWNQLVSKEKGEKSKIRDFKNFPISKNIPSCGPVIFSLMFYPRDKAMVQGTGFSLDQLKEYLSHNGGVKIYRDDISVKPYGFSGKDGEDWLNLGERQGQNPAGIGREDWMVKNNQILGAIYINRDENPQLKDSAAREGLIHNEAYYDLRGLVLAGVRLLELHRYNIQNNRRNQTTDEAKENSKKLVENYKTQIQNLKLNLIRSKKDVKEEGNKKIIKTITTEIESFLETINTTEKAIDDLLSKQRILGGLATVGIASAVFGHEIQNSITQFKMANKEALFSLDKSPPDIQDAKSELSSAQTYADQVASWGKFALSRIKRDKRKRRKQNIKQIIGNLINELKTTFSARGIQINSNLNNIEARAFPMDIETIVVNLLTNAYSACLENSRNRIINVDLKNLTKNNINGYEITVSDSGKGIAKKLQQMIWEPLYTTKSDSKGNQNGTGLGLSIVNSIVSDLKGEKSVSKDLVLKGAKISIWLPN